MCSNHAIVVHHAMAQIMYMHLYKMEFQSIQSKPSKNVLGWRNVLLQTLAQLWLALDYF